MPPRRKTPSEPSKSTRFVHRQHLPPPPTRPSRKRAHEVVNNTTARHRAHDRVPHFNPLPSLSSTPGELFVFGAGSMGELGLGPTPGDRNVKRPRLNAHLRLQEVGVVDVAVGGMHCAAVDRGGRVWTWGVNDQGALGRDTTVEDNDDNGEESDSEEELNTKESIPGVVNGFPSGVNAVKVVCGDSITVCIASDGKVYSWGTFRVPPILLPA
jgi:regulator of chromosome condensation